VRIGPAAELDTPRLRLTAVREADADEMAVVLGDPRLHEFIGGAPLAAPQLRAQYRRWVAGSANPAEIWLNWVVRLLATGEAVGIVQATVTERPGGPASAEVAWVIGMPWQGHSYAAEAAAALVSWLSSAGVSEISACIHPQHRASERVAERAGFTVTDAMVDGERVWRRQQPATRPGAAGPHVAGPPSAGPPVAPPPVAGPPAGRAFHHHGELSAIIAAGAP
jgi:RimJ/RimL family protein N-acetyltransferase